MNPVVCYFKNCVSKKEALQERRCQLHAFLLHQWFVPMVGAVSIIREGARQWCCTLRGLMGCFRTLFDLSNADMQTATRECFVADGTSKPRGLQHGCQQCPSLLTSVIVCQNLLGLLQNVLPAFASKRAARLSKAPTVCKGSRTCVSPDC